MGDAARKKYNLDDWLMLSDNSRLELIDGELVEKASPSAEHGFAQLKFGQMLAPFMRKMGDQGGPGGWWIGSDIHVAYSSRPGGFLHDVVGWRRDRHPLRPTGRRVRERPDWVCEIISLNRNNDTRQKRSVLHEEGVAHYWMLDFRDNRLEVLRWVEGGYLLVEELFPGDRRRVEPFEEIEFDMNLLLGIED